MIRFGLFLVQRGVITAADLVDALRIQLDRRPTLGQVALATGKLSIAQVSAILSRQSDIAGKAFGEVAKELGVLTHEDIATLLGAQQMLDAPLKEVLIERGAIGASQFDRELSIFRWQMRQSDPEISAMRDQHIPTSLRLTPVKRDVGLAAPKKAPSPTPATP